MKSSTIVLLLLLIFACNSKNKDVAESKTMFDENNCDYLKLFGERCFDEANDTSLYLLFEYDAYKDTSLIISICKLGNTFLQRTSYIDPIANFNLQYLTNYIDSLEFIYNVHTSEIQTNKVEKILAILDQSNFWNLSFDNPEKGVFDGNYISISVMNRGKRHKIVRRDKSTTEFTTMIDSIFTIVGLENFSPSNRNYK